MGSVNKAILVGNLGRDAEMRFTAGGTPVATVSLATTERYTDREGQKREDTQWHRIVIFNDRLADVAQQYLKKGMKVFVEGQLQTRKWTDKESGQEKYTTEVVISRFKGDFQMLDSRGSSGGESYDNGGGESSRPMSRSSGSARPSAPKDFDDDIPF